MKAKTAILAIVLAISTISVSAQEALFFDTSEAKTFFNYGARIGFNSSNITNSSTKFTSNVDSWGTGFDMGAVVDINLRNYLTIQPGLFFDVKNNRYCHSTNKYDKDNNTLNLTSREGRTRHTTFTIPVLASVRFNFSNQVRWYLDCGPYFQFGIGGSDKGDSVKLNTANNDLDYNTFDEGYYNTRNRFDFGFRIGTALRVYDHYYLGIHYDAGFCKAYKDADGGHNKAWNFSIGYDF